MYKNLLALLLSVVIIGCGSTADTTSAKTNTSSQASSISSSSSSKSGASNDANVSIKIELIPDDANVTLKRINAYDINASKISTSFSTDKRVLSTPLIKEDLINKAIFIDGLFQGIVASQVNVSNTSELTLKQPNDIAEVLESYEINLDASSAKVANKTKQRLLKGIGKYDYMNTEPLSYEIVTVSHFDSNKRTKMQEPALRIHIPKGYTFPIKRERTQLDVNSTNKRISAQVTFNHEVNQHYDLGYTTNESNITITTEGSYIEFGLATYLHAEGRLSTRASRRYASFEFSQSAYFTSNLELLITGEYEDDWSTVIELVNADAHVYIPITNVTMIDIAFHPSIRVGASGRIYGQLEANSFATRTGSYEVTYDSRRESNRLRTSNDIDASARDLDNHTVTIDFEASANSYVTPTLSIRPGISMGGLMSISTLSLDGGIRLDADLEGHIDQDFVVTNDIQDISLEARSSLDISMTPWLSYKAYVALDPLIGRTRVFYEGDEHMLYEGNPIEIMQFEAILLRAPNVIESEIGGLKYITFDIDLELALKQYVRYYYTLDGSTPTENEEYLWDGTPFILEANHRIGLKATIKTDDYSSSIWAFGKSVSPTIYKNIEGLAPLPSKPTEVKAEGANSSINLSWSTSQNSDYYTIWVADNALSGFANVARTGSLEYVYNSLSSNIKYFKIKACKDDGTCSEYSDVISAKASSVIKSKANANAGADQVGIFLAKGKIRLDASNSTTTLGSIVSYTWRENSTVLSTDMIYEATYSFGTHTIELEIRDSNGNIDTDTVIVKIKNLPTTPTGFEATSGFNSVSLKWNNSVDVTYYEIYHDDQENGFYYWLAEIAHPNDTLNLTFSNYTHNVEDDTIHYYKIRSCDRELDRCSSFSDVVSAKRNPMLILK